MWLEATIWAVQFSAGGGQTSSVKGQTENILDFERHAVPAGTTQLCHFSAEVITYNK